MAERAERIQVSIDQAEKDRTMAQKLLEQYQNRLKDADSEADGIIRAAREHAGAEAERILSDNKAEAERILEAARVRIEAERLAAMTLFRAEAAALVVRAAGRLLRRELAGAEQQRYAAEVLDQLVLDPGNRE
jgi:F-type H+-transporting ATPase subunit b